MVYFISDTHFGHSAIITLCNRPFSSVEEMNEEMIANWNCKVGENDVVYILGDFAYRAKPETVECILKQLKGKKRLILGNHDGSWFRQRLKKHFDSIDIITDISVCDRGAILYHYPLLTYHHEAKRYMIHGHIHNNIGMDYWPLLRNRPLVLNAGVDVNHFEPVTLEELIENNLLWKDSH